jgi:hypothetical protein
MSSSSLFSRHSIVLQTSFSEVKRQASEQPFLLVGTPGSVSVREVKGSSFYYRQFYDAEGKKSAGYLGPLGNPETESRASAVRGQIALSNALIRDTRLLTQQGYVRVDARTCAVLAALANRGLFRGGAVLVGSHAYGALLNELGVRAPAFSTEDVDVARGDPLEIAPGDDDFERMLAGSTVPLHPVPGLGRNAPSTSYKPPGADRFRVDLLTPTAGKEVTTKRIPELKAHATALPFLRYVLTDPLEGIVIGREGIIPVRVPKPEAFVWHKMLVSQLRTTTSEKKGKDILQAAVLFAVLAEDAPEALESAFAGLPRSARSKVDLAAKAVLRALESTPHERAVHLLRNLR